MGYTYRVEIFDFTAEFEANSTSTNDCDVLCLGDVLALGLDK